MFKFNVIFGLCAAIVSVGNAGNTTEVAEEKRVKDNVAEASEFGNLYDLGSVSSSLLSSGLNFEMGFKPIISAPNTESHHQRDDAVKTITVTKNVPVPYTVTVEKRVPVRVEVPVDKPYPVYVPRPYQVVVEKKVPYEVKVPIPQPYTVEKHVPVPVKVHVARPYPVHIPAPYPVFMVRKVPYMIEKQVPFPVRVPVVRPYPVHVTVEKKVLYPVEKTVPYPVEVHVERPVPVPVEKPYPVQVEKQVPVPVEKLIPVPIKIPVPIPAMSHNTGSSPVNNDYYMHEQQEPFHHQVYQHHSVGGDNKVQENIIGQSETAHQEVPVYQGHQQQRYHYEQVPVYQTPQAYGPYGELQQHRSDSKASQESIAATYNTIHASPIDQHVYSNHQQDARAYRNDEPKNQQQFLSIEDYHKAVHDEYTRSTQGEQGTGNENVKGFQEMKDEYSALRAQSGSEDGKQESYFKVHMGSSGYKNSVQHGLQTTG